LEANLTLVEGRVISTNGGVCEKAGALQIRPMTFLELLPRSARTRIISPDVGPIRPATGSAARHPARYGGAQGRLAAADVYRRLGTN
jgi:hypothetical protein